LVVQRQRLPVPDSVVMTQGERILFAIPWGERTILGTTDTDYSGPIEDVRADASDISYVLGVVNHFFPKALLRNSDVLSVWAGLRPLIADPKGAPSEVSRSHEIHSPEPGWWDVAGGKLTTYRLMAEQTVDRAVKWLRRDNGTFGRCRTAQEPLLPSDQTAGLSGILPPEPSSRAVEHYVNREWSLRLDDVMLRRTSWHYYSTEAAALAQRVADWMSGPLGWSPQTRSAEIERYTRAAAMPQ
jgi:glycerol-3-phosphate dehydrogenase